METTDKKSALSPEEWLRIVEECTASDLPVPEYCAQTGVGVSHYYRWRRRLHGKSAQSKGSKGVGMFEPSCRLSPLKELPRPRHRLGGRARALERRNGLFYLTREALKEVEERIRSKKLLEEAKVAYRGEHTKPLVEKFFEWLAATCQERPLLPTDPFMKAAVYALKRKDALRVFLSNAGVAMDTNHEERALRVIPMGRRNYLLVGRSLAPPVLAGFRACLLPASYMESIRIPIWSTFYTVFRLIRYGMCRSLRRGC